MKRHATERNEPSGNQRQFHGPTFAKVKDGRKQDIRGLWVRNGRYYARLTFEDGNTGERKTRRVPLVDKDKKAVTSVAQAIEAMNRLKVSRADNDLPVLTRTPRFADYVKTYLDFIRSGEDGAGAMKKPRTLLKERYTLDGWKKHMGGAHLDKIRPAHINAFIAKRLQDGASRRTVNLDVTILRNVLRHAMQEGRIKILPTATIKRLKHTAPTRTLFTVEDLEGLCKAASDKREDGSPVTKNAVQFVDYVRLLAYCGAREQEALALRWQDVDFERGQLTIGATGDTKNSKARTVDFNPKLRTHLEDMATRLAPDSQWVFPSPQRGERDIRAQTFRESLKLVRKHAGMAKRAFHDLRHHFISYAVMSGVDFMTIASWVGHQDGGVLIGKVYGHLANEHKKAMAEKLNFGPAVLERAANQ